MDNCIIGTCKGKLIVSSKTTDIIIFKCNKCGCEIRKPTEFKKIWKKKK